MEETGRSRKSNSGHPTAHPRSVFLQPPRRSVVCPTTHAVYLFRALGSVVAAEMFFNIILYLLCILLYYSFSFLCFKMFTRVVLSILCFVLLWVSTPPFYREPKGCGLGHRGGGGCRSGIPAASAVRTEL